MRKICLNHSDVPLLMREKYLLQWLIDATQDDRPNTTNWQKVFAIVQAEFRDGTLSEEITWKTVILIPKVTSADFGGIGLIELPW